MKWKPQCGVVGLSLLVACAAQSAGGGGNAGAGGVSGVGGAGGTAGVGGTAAVGGSAGFGGVGGVAAAGGSGGFGSVGGFGGVTGGTIASDGGPGCDNDLVVTVRDFKETHPDFEHFGGPQLDGIVQPDLGPDNKPVYAQPGGTACTTGPTEFNQWYRDTPGVNMRVPVNIQFTETSPGVFVFDSAAFFPIDMMGFGNGPAVFMLPFPIPGLDTLAHNYLFTTEIHTLFTYKGGEVFTFRGDDDLWVFINKKLAIDLGGPHGPEMESINMDARAGELGITIGQTYPMDIFHAERHTTGSNFRIETTIDFSCVINIPPLE